jgi:hypothetical protein
VNVWGNQFLIGGEFKHFGIQIKELERYVVLTLSNGRELTVGQTTLIPSCNRRRTGKTSAGKILERKITYKEKVRFCGPPRSCGGQYDPEPQPLQDLPGGQSPGQTNFLLL